MARLSLIVSLVFVNLTAHTFPCTKYVFDFPGKAFPGRIKISWSVNTGFNNCGVPAEETSKQSFVIKIQNLFDDVMRIDTIHQNHFLFNTKLAENTFFMISIREVGGPNHEATLYVKPEHEQMPHLRSTIDTLNFFLMNGYFLNALPLLESLKQNNLIDEIKTEYRVLFPEHYPHEQNCFNSYFDSDLRKMIKMPEVSGLADFVETINDINRANPSPGKGFKAFLTVAPDGKLIDYEVIPESEKETFEKGIQHLKFRNQHSQMAIAVIAVGPSKNKRRFMITNERALIDQRSPGFKTNYRRKGPIH